MYIRDMCRRNFISFKSYSKNAPKIGFVPCGECPSCRAVNRRSWAFRLRVEMESLVKQGWQVGFITLTYREETIPRLPEWMLNSFGKENLNILDLPMCFNKDHIRGLVKYLRNWLYRTKKLCKDTKLRYMICSEFGDKTERSHYHGLFCVPPQINLEEFYNQIRDYWTFNYGNIIPRYYNGGTDYKGRNHKPFKVDCVSKACVYTAKYVCKDLNYQSYLNKQFVCKKIGFDDDKDNIKNYLPFHIQSKSLGLSFVENMPAEKKLDYYLNGVSFVGERVLQQLPVYIKNKLLFHNYYIVDGYGKRLCKRLASVFFRENYKEIFKQKVNDLEQIVKQWSNKEYEAIDKNSTKYNSNTLFTKLDKSVHEICEDYIAYGGLIPSSCYNLPREMVWFSRYKDIHKDEGAVVDWRWSLSWSLLDESYLNNLNDYFNLCFTQFNLEQKEDDYRKNIRELELQRLRSINHN